MQRTLGRKWAATDAYRSERETVWILAVSWDTALPGVRQVRWSFYLLQNHCAQFEDLLRGAPGNYLSGNGWCLRASSTKARARSSGTLQSDGKTNRLSCRFTPTVPLVWCACTRGFRGPNCTSRWSDTLHSIGSTLFTRHHAIVMVQWQSGNVPYGTVTILTTHQRACL